MKRTKSTLSMSRWLLVSTLICGSAAVFTSCGNNTLEEILGTVDNPAPIPTINFAESEKWWGTMDGKFTLAVTNTGDGVVTYSSSNPSAASVDPTTGEVTPGTVTSTTDVIITATVADSKNATYPTKTAQYTLKVGKGYRYLTWDDTNKKLVYHFDYPASDNDFIDSSTGAESKLASGGGVKFVKGNVTINVTSTDITIGNDLLLILLDGAKLEINGKLTVATSKVLSISAQSEGDDKGELVVKHSKDVIDCKHDMNIYGGKITAESTGTGSYKGINVDKSLNIYGGDVTAKGANATSDDGGEAIYGPFAGILITGKAIVNAIGGNSSSNEGGYGVYGNVTVSGEAQLTATGGSTEANDYRGGNGILNLTIDDNSYVKAQGGDTNGTNYNGGYGVGEQLTYKGGKFEAYGGKEDNGTKYKWGVCSTLKNQSSAPIVFETSTDGTTWPADGKFTLSAGSSAMVSTTSELQKRGVRRK